MKEKKFFILVLISFYLINTNISAETPAAENQPDVETIVKKIDELFRSDSSYAEMEMHIMTPNWVRTLRMKAWTEGMEKTFIRIISPAKERGVATLRIGTEMWNYLPRTNKVIKIPPSMMMSSWMGSDFTNDDLVKELTFLDDYTYELTQLNESDEELYYIRFTPKENRPIVWGEVVAAVRKKDYIPVWQKYYDESGKLMRVMEFKEIKDFDGRKIPSVLELVPQTKEGHKTVIRYLELEFNPKLSEEIFSLRNLRSGQNIR